MNLSLRERIIAYMKRNHTTSWIPKAKLCELAREATGATWEHTGRRLRELEVEGTLEVRYGKKHHAEYRFKEFSLIDHWNKTPDYSLAKTQV
jgi:hypothetical protein